MQAQQSFGLRGQNCIDKAKKAALPLFFVAGGDCSARNGVFQTYLFLSLAFLPF
jgi:hypothetical protein